MLQGVPLSLVVPGPEFLLIIQLLVGLHGVVGLGVCFRLVFSVQGLEPCNNPFWEKCNQRIEKKPLIADT
jgi:hypothetical protein